METRNTTKGIQNQVLEAIDALNDLLDNLCEEHTRHRGEHREALADLRLEVAAQLKNHGEPEASLQLSECQGLMSALPPSGEDRNYAG